jgi:hypothetical protein
MLQWSTRRKSQVDTMETCLKLSPVERRQRIIDHMTHGPVTGTMLARLFGVSESTAYRDLDALRRCGQIAHIGRGYRLNHGWPMCRVVSWRPAISSNPGGVGL